MATITKSMPSTTKTDHLRPFNARRDLEAVADLVELCFGDTMDPDGKRYVERLRSAARSNSLLHWMSPTTDWAGVSLGGYVWQQDDRIVGNASLIPYSIRGKCFYLIANVAVHPGYRLQGIGRQLTEQAVEHARRKGCPAVWLHVREENDVAVGLYRSLGFIERARRTTWHSKADPQPTVRSKGIKIDRIRPLHWDLQRAWLLQSYPPELSWHMPFKISALRPGFLGAFNRFLYNVIVKQWAVFQKEHLLATVSWQPTAGYANALWLASPPDGDETPVQALLAHARQHAPSPRPLVLEYPAWQHVQAIQEAGFDKQQTLIWMSLSLQKLA